MIVLGLSRHFPDPRGATRRFVSGGGQPSVAYCGLSQRFRSELRICFAYCFPHDASLHEWIGGD